MGSQNEAVTQPANPSMDKICAQIDAIERAEQNAMDAMRRALVKIHDLETALGKAADTFHDLKVTLALMNRHTLANACQIAEAHARAALAKDY